MDSKTIAIAGEITPAKTIIPVIKKLRRLEEEGGLSFKIDKIIGLYHGESAKTFLDPVHRRRPKRGEELNSKAGLSYFP